MDRKKVLWTLLSALIAVLCIMGVLSQDKTFSFREFCDFFISANDYYLVLAAVCMCGYFFFEGLAITRMANELGYSSKRFGTLYGAADVYFSAITPSATGGQPASAYFMILDGIPAYATTAILLTNLIVYITALIAVGAVSLITHWRMFLQYSDLSRFLIAAGSAAMILLAGIFFLLLRHQTLLYNICNHTLYLLEKLHLIRNGESLRKRLLHTMEDYHTCSDLMFSKKRLLTQVLGLNLLQRFSQVTAVFFVYLALGYNLATAAAAWHVQNLAVLGSNCIPVPGAMGVADYLMLDGYTILLGDEELAVSIELLCRGFSFYGCILISGLIVLIGYLVRKVKKC